MAGDNQILITVGAVLDDLKGAFAQATDWITSFASSGSSSLEQVSDSAQTSGEQISESFDSVRESLNHLLELLGVYEAFKWGKEAVFSGMELADQLYRTNTITGISVQELQRLKFAAEATGTSFEQVTRMVEFAGRALLELRSSSGGGERIKTALSDLGLKESDLADNEHLLDKVAAGLAKVHNAATRLGDMRSIFGRMGADALPMLTHLRELEDEFNKLGFAVSDSGVAKAWEAGEAWNKLGSVWEFVKLQLSADLAPALKLVADLLVEASGSLDAWLKTAAAGDFGRKLANETIDLAEAIHNQLGPALQDLKGFFEDASRAGEVLKGVMEFLFTGVQQGTADIEKGLTGGKVDLKSVGTGLMGGSWVDKGASAPATPLTPSARQDNVSRTFAENFRPISAHSLVDDVGKSLDKAQPKMDAFTSAAEKMRASINAPAQSDILNQFKPASGSAPPGGMPQTPQEIVQEIAARAKGQESLLAITEAGDKQRLAYGQETAAQEIAQEQALANQKYQIQLTALQKEAAVAGLKPAEAAKINAQIEELENAHTAQMIGLATKLTEAQNKEAQQRVENEIRAQNQQLEVSKALVELHEKMGEITPAQAAQIKVGIDTSELDKEKAELEGLLANNQLALADRQKYSQQVQDIDQKLTLALIANQQAVVEATQKAAQDSAKAWQDGLAPVSKTIDGLINDVLDATRKAGESIHKVLEGEFRKTAAGLVKSLIDSGLTALLTGGGNKGTITGELFGTAGGGANAPGGKGTAGVLGLGGGLSGLLSQVIPGGPGGLLGKAFQEAEPAIKQVLQTAWQGLQSVISSIFGIALKAGGNAVAGAAGAAGNAAAGAATNAAGNAAGAAAQSGALSAALTVQTVTLTGDLVTLGVTISTAITASTALITAGLTALAAEETAIAGLEAANFAKPSFLGFTFAEGGIVPSAAGGMVVGGSRGGVPAILHPREMVLPANISEGVQNMVARGNGGADAAAAGAQGGDFHQHNTFHSSAIDGRGLGDLFNAHADKIGKAAADYFSRRGGRYPAFGAG